MHTPAMEGRRAPPQSPLGDGTPRQPADLSHQAMRHAAEARRPSSESCHSCVRDQCPFRLRTGPAQRRSVLEVH